MPDTQRVTSRDLPLIKRGVIATRRDDQIILRHLRDEVVLEGAAADLFGKVHPLLDGQVALSELSEKVAESPARLRELTEQLERVGVLAFLAEGEEAPHLTGLEFYRVHRAYGLHWLGRVYEHPLWEKIRTGQASRAQVLGFAFEKYHYIEAAFEHMGTAAANATPEMMPHLARHFIEEYTHGDIYRKGLRSLFADEVILGSQPLPSTRALVNYLSETAQRSSFAYYAGNEVLQMTENTDHQGTSEAVQQFYAGMRKHYPYTERLIDSFIAHTRADQKLGHADAFLRMCESVPPLTRSEVNDALNVARNMAEHLLLFMDGIEVVYGNVDTVPRPAAHLLSE